MLQLNILGNLGRDAEVKTINNKEYLSFSVASTEKQGEQENTTWVSVLASHNPNLMPFLKKGQQVFVSGRMKAGIYQSQQNFGIDISVFAQTLQLCGGKREEQTTTPAGSSAGNVLTPKHPEANAGVDQQAWINQAQQAQSPFPPADNSDDDSGLPF